MIFRAICLATLLGLVLSQSLPTSFSIQTSIPILSSTRQSFTLPVSSPAQGTEVPTTTTGTLPTTLSSNTTISTSSEITTSSNATTTTDGLTRSSDTSMVGSTSATTSVIGTGTSSATLGQVARLSTLNVLVGTIGFYLVF
ncbi:hypothetical protein M422DRAFT_22928 [Sphaerobolus stellatus SS14]|nr:hypothetical protein M422DRAFT_22928 [Sphaerobolus stellatus SS14]